MSGQRQNWKHSNQVSSTLTFPTRKLTQQWGKKFDALSKELGRDTLHTHWDQKKGARTCVLRIDFHPDTLPGTVFVEILRATEQAKTFRFYEPIGRSQRVRHGKPVDQPFEQPVARA